MLQNMDTYNFTEIMKVSWKQVWTFRHQKKDQIWVFGKNSNKCNFFEIALSQKLSGPGRIRTGGLLRVREMS